MYYASGSNTLLPTGYLSPIIVFCLFLVASPLLYFRNNPTQWPSNSVSHIGEETTRGKEYLVARDRSGFVLLVSRVRYEADYRLYEQTSLMLLQSHYTSILWLPGAPLLILSMSKRLLVSQRGGVWRAVNCTRVWVPEAAGKSRPPALTRLITICGFLRYGQGRSTTNS